MDLKMSSEINEEPTPPDPALNLAHIPPPHALTSSQCSDGLPLAVPPPMPVNTPADAPVAALRRYLDTLPQHPSPRKEVRWGGGGKIEEEDQEGAGERRRRDKDGEDETREKRRWVEDGEDKARENRRWGGDGEKGAREKIRWDEDGEDRVREKIRWDEEGEDKIVERKVEGRKEEVSSGDVWRAVRSEVLATFLMTIATASVAIQPPRPPLPPLLAPCAQPVGELGEWTSDTVWAWAWAVRWAVGHGLVMGGLSWAVRAAHLAPPTTIALLVTRRVSLVRACLHLLGQVCGCLLAAPVLLGLLPRPPRPPQLAPRLTPAQGWGAEFLATVLVTLVSLSAYPSPRTTHPAPLHSHPHPTPLFLPTAALPVTAANIAAALFCAEFTGIGLNPARSLAVAMVTGAWASHWVFWVGPALGGLLAAFTHEYTAAKLPCLPPTPQHQPNLPRELSRPSALTSTLASPC